MTSGPYYSNVLRLRGRSLDVEVSPRQPTVGRSLRTVRRAGVKRRRAWLDRQYIAHQNFCNYCARGLLRSEMSVDHIVALSKGGSDEEENWAVSCRSCNCEKGNKEGHR